MAVRVRERHETPWEAKQICMQCINCGRMAFCQFAEMSKAATEHRLLYHGGGEGVHMRIISPTTQGPMVL